MQRLYPLDEVKVKVSSELIVSAAVGDWQAWGAKVVQVASFAPDTKHIASLPVSLPENT